MKLNDYLTSKIKKVILKNFLEEYLKDENVKKKLKEIIKNSYDSIKFKAMIVILTRGCTVLNAKKLFIKILALREI